MKFNPEVFAENIQSNYIEYGSPVDEVFCHIFDRDKNKSDFENFSSGIKGADFFDDEKLDKADLLEIKLDYAKLAIISSIIKESKYNTHFIDWEQGEKFTNEFFSQFDKIETIYTNAGFDNDDFDNKVNENELMMVGWHNFSRYYWYDYGFIIISDEKVGVLWFGDDS